MGTICGTPTVVQNQEAGEMRGFQAAIPIQATLAISLVATAFTLAEAQVVQLPSTRSLSYSGSTWVPDGGTTDLGGVSAAYSSQGRRGASYVAGSNLGVSSLSASIQIIDLAALDEAILGSARPGGRMTVVATPAAGSIPGSAPGGVAVGTASPLAEPVSAVDSVSALRKAQVNPRPATDLSEPISPRIGTDPGKYLRVLSGPGDFTGRPPSQLESDIRYYVGQGEQAENAGRVIAARVFYKMARDLMTPELIARYDRIVTERRAVEDARIKAEVEAVRRKF